MRRMQEADMQAIQNQAARKLHPVIWVAAVSVIVFSLVGIGAVTGLIPTSSSQPAAEKLSLIHISEPTRPY